MVPVDLRRVVWQREPHAVGHPAVGEELNGLLCASGPIGAHQQDLMLLLCVKGGEVLVVAVCELG